MLHRQLAFQWRAQAPGNTDEQFEAHAKVRLIPLLLLPDGTSLQDSTHIILSVERRLGLIHGDGGGGGGLTLLPRCATLRMVSFLLEEWADEWANKWMFHHRWSTPEDCSSAAHRVLASMLPPGAAADSFVAQQIVQRMKRRKQRFVGVSPDTEEALERSLRDVMALLEKHFRQHPYVLGRRVTFADFAIFGQFYCMSTDPTTGAMMQTFAPCLSSYVRRMTLGCPLDCAAPTASWKELSPTLLPLLEASVSGWFLPWAAVNAQAVQQAEKSFSVTLPGNVMWTQEASRFQAKTLQQLRQRYTELAEGDTTVAAVMESCGCREYLEQAQRAPLSRL